MEAKEFLTTYQGDTQIRVLATQLKGNSSNRQLKGLFGSLDAVVASSVYLLKPQQHLFILHDREEAAYFQNDMQNLLGKEVFIFPSSYKKVEIKRRIVLTVKYLGNDTGD